MEIRALKNQGLISSYWEYDMLPLPVIEDVRLLMAAEADAREMGS